MLRVMEVWIDPELLARAADASAFAAGAELDARLACCQLGQEASHTALLHPTPLFPKQLCLVPSRLLTEVVPAEGVEGEEAAEVEAPAEVGKSPEV